jgi:FeS assembly SUF system protein
MADELRDRVIAVLKTVHDPEIPVNIYELGLIYNIDISSENDVAVRMTLTAPNCPVADSMPAQVKYKVENLPGVRSAKVEIVFDPPWDRSKMSDAAKFALGFDLDLGRDVVPLSKIK